LSIAIQCKHYSQPVGNKAVQEVYSGKDFYNTDIAVVVTNNEFTKSAKELASSLDVLLIHHSELKEFDRCLFLRRK
jgi:HJR/Mrr/RecB family endonuclease